MYYKNEFHLTTYLYPLVRACGGTRQDLSVEGAPSILMNLPLYLQFPNWRMGACGTAGDGILATNLYIYLRSVEVVALFRVLSILHILICMPVRWLASKTAELSDYDFGIWAKRWICLIGLFSEIFDKVDPCSKENLAIL